MIDPQQEAGTAFVRWLEHQVVSDARGNKLAELETKPSDRLWLGRLAPESAAWKAALGERGQRLDPCSAGFRFRPRASAPWSWSAAVGLCVWTREGEKDDRRWVKSERIEIGLQVDIPVDSAGSYAFGADAIAKALKDAGISGYVGRLDVDVTRDSDGISVAAVFANDSEEKRGFDPNFYEVTFELEVGELQPFILDSLPDSFRYDRRVVAYGINGGVEYEGGRLRATDVIVAERKRPEYWDDSIGPEPNLEFSELARNPVPPLRELVTALRTWGEREWSNERLNNRAAEESWSPEMVRQARKEAVKFAAEVERCEEGLEMLRRDDVLMAFKLMNEAFVHSGGSRYTCWRPFQLGFLLASLRSLVEADDRSRMTVDTLWFATGGGKTETYLAVIVFSCLFDRIRGKTHGITSWSRFPLRMLSLQQTQRFADALAGAELARRRHDLGGDAFGLGFLVGRNGTPNRVRFDAESGDADANDPEMPRRNRVLLHCPFCRSTDLEMHFDKRHWRLEHRCTNPTCEWPEAGLPFCVVDEEIFRSLPSVVVGTLDKAASISMQAAMRGLYASPIGLCNGPGHGFTYAPRQHTKGCLVPGCEYGVTDLPQALELFAPSLRVQDELHLLRGGLGAIDAHYETLLDHLYRATKSPPAKIIASSATLSGYEEQVEALYCREGVAFPQPGPQEGVSFWTKDQPQLARRFVGLAPRGVTQEFANDRTAESLQRAIRRLESDPVAVCAEAGIDAAHVQFLIDNYGTHVVYGSKVRDVEAAARSFETQPGVEPLNVAKLTGATLLEEVRNVLDRLAKPEPDFEDRLHVICASSMMSHGVDVDRFNAITLLGMPLTTAEFIQTTARIGRRYPGLVFVIHRMGTERDASVFRSFDVFVRHGDRFIEPIAITRKSRRVLDLTFAGLFMARVLGVHEPRQVRLGERQITRAADLRRYVQAKPVTEEEEFANICDALGLDPNATDDPLVEEARRLMRDTFRELLDPASRANLIKEVTPSEPMLSLREVETQVPIHVSIDGRRRGRR